MSPTAKGNIVKAKDEVLGVKVQNTQEDDLGKVYELMLDKLSGQVVYVVLESGSFLGMGGKLFAIPWNAISYDPDKDCFILDADKDRLQNAPGFESDAWPDMGDKSFFDTIVEYFGGTSKGDTSSSAGKSTGSASGTGSSMGTGTSSGGGSGHSGESAGSSSGECSCGDEKAHSHEKSHAE